MFILSIHCFFDRSIVRFIRVCKFYLKLFSLYLLHFSPSIFRKEKQAFVFSKQSEVTFRTLLYHHRLDFKIRRFTFLDILHYTDIEFLSIVSTLIFVLICVKGKNNHTFVHQLCLKSKVPNCVCFSYICCNICPYIT